MLSPQPYPDPTPLQQPQASMHQYKKLPVNFEYRPVEQFNYPYVGPFAALPKSQPTERISASWENLHQLCSNSLVELVFSPPQPQTVLTADNQETVITKIPQSQKHLTWLVNHPEHAKLVFRYYLNFLNQVLYFFDYVTSVNPKNIHLIIPITTMLDIPRSFQPIFDPCATLTKEEEDELAEFSSWTDNDECLLLFQKDVLLPKIQQIIQLKQQQQIQQQQLQQLVSSPGSLFSASTPSVQNTSSSSKPSKKEKGNSAAAQSSIASAKNKHLQKKEEEKQKQNVALFTSTATVFDYYFKECFELPDPLIDANTTAANAAAAAAAAAQNPDSDVDFESLFLQQTLNMQQPQQIMSNQISFRQPPRLYEPIFFAKRVLDKIYFTLIRNERLFDFVETKKIRKNMVFTLTNMILKLVRRRAELMRNYAAQFESTEEKSDEERHQQQQQIYAQVQVDLITDIEQRLKKLGFQSIQIQSQEMLRLVEHFYPDFHALVTDDKTFNFFMKETENIRKYRSQNARRVYDIIELLKSGFVDIRTYLPDLNTLKHYITQRMVETQQQIAHEMEVQQGVAKIQQSLQHFAQYAQQQNQQAQQTNEDGSVMNQSEDGENNNNSDSMTMDPNQTAPHPQTSARLEKLKDDLAMYEGFLRTYFTFPHPAVSAAQAQAAVQAAAAQMKSEQNDDQNANSDGTNLNNDGTPLDPNDPNFIASQQFNAQANPVTVHQILLLRLWANCCHALWWLLTNIREKYELKLDKYNLFRKMHGFGDNTLEKDLTWIYITKVFERLTQRKKNPNSPPTTPIPGKRKRKNNSSPPDSPLTGSFFNDSSTINMIQQQQAQQAAQVAATALAAAAAQQQAAAQVAAAAGFVGLPPSNLFGPVVPMDFANQAAQQGMQGMNNDPTVGMNFDGSSMNGNNMNNGLGMENGVPNANQMDPNLFGGVSMDFANANGQQGMQNDPNIGMNYDSSNMNGNQNGMDANLNNSGNESSGEGDDIGPSAPKRRKTSSYGSDSEMQQQTQQGLQNQMISNQQNAVLQQNQQNDPNVPQNAFEVACSQIQECYSEMQNLDKEMQSIDIQTRDKENELNRVKNEFESLKQAKIEKQQLFLKCSQQLETLMFVMAQNSGQNPGNFQQMQQFQQFQQMQQMQQMQMEEDMNNDNSNGMNMNNNVNQSGGMMNMGNGMNMNQGSFF